MKRQVLLGLFVLAALLFTACDGIDLSQISDEDISRFANQAIVCNPPYMRLGTGCCLDQDNNSICDVDEKDFAQVDENFDSSQLYEDDYDKIHEDDEEEDTIGYEAKKMIRKAEENIAEAHEKILKRQNEGADVEEAIARYEEAKQVFQDALKQFDEEDFMPAREMAIKAYQLAEDAYSIAKKLEAEDDELEYGDVELAFAVTDEGVVLEWNKYEGDGFKGYKVVKSYNTEHPKYPEDGYISYITDIDTTRFVDTEPLKDNAYYAITVLTSKESVYSNSVEVESEVENQDDDHEDEKDMDDDAEDDDSEEDNSLDDINTTTSDTNETTA